MSFEKERQEICKFDKAVSNLQSKGVKLALKVEIGNTFGTKAREQYVWLKRNKKYVIVV